MDQIQRLEYMLHYLLEETSRYRGATIPEGAEERWQLTRALMNMRPAEPIGNDFLEVQDAYLQEVVRTKGSVAVEELGSVESNPQLALWQGDITRLKVDAIVNAANSALLGCFIPGHNCIDNAIHSYAGVQLRLECAKLMNTLGHEEPTGSAQITSAYNLPSKHVIHTVGPIISNTPTQQDNELLASCYHSCLALAQDQGLSSIAFCCISTGEFRFPKEEAAEIAVQTTTEFLRTTGAQIKVVFDVFKEIDYDLYQRLL